MSQLFNTLTRFVVAFLPRSNRLLISWLRSPSTVILGLQRRKSVTTSIFSPFYLPWYNGAGCHDLSCLFVCFLIFRLKPALSLFFFTLIKRLFSLSLLSANRVVSSENPHRKKLTPISWLLTSLPLFLFPFYVPWSNGVGCHDLVLFYFFNI